MYSVFQDRFVYMCAPSSWSARHFGAHGNVWRCQIMAVRSSVQSRLAAGPRKEYGLNITFGQKRLYIASVRRKIPRSKHYICPTQRCKIINSRWSQSLSHLLWLNGRDQMPHRKHYPSTDLDFEQDKVNNADSAFIFLIIQSQNQWSGWTGQRRWSCLVLSLLES